LCKLYENGHGTSWICILFFPIDWLLLEKSVRRGNQFCQNTCHIHIIEILIVLRLKFSNEILKHLGVHISRRLIRYVTADGTKKVDNLWNHYYSLTRALIKGLPMLQNLKNIQTSKQSINDERDMTSSLLIFICIKCYWSSKEIVLSNPWYGTYIKIC
jgi:hypothetical protein